MSPSHRTLRRRLFPGRPAVVVVVVALLLSAGVSTSSAADLATIAKQLAANTAKLADARTSLTTVSDELDERVRGHEAKRGRVEARLVAIYKHGDSSSALQQVADGTPMQDVGTTLDAIDAIATSDAKLLRDWNREERRIKELTAQRAALQTRIKNLERAVRAGREDLSEAERRAAAQRRAAEEMARSRESTIMPLVANPESTTSGAAARTDAIAASVADDSSTAPAASASTPAPSSANMGVTQTGEASMYADSFTGEKTANGERYDPNAFTAASTTLPLGTWVTVRGPRGSVAVRINDRGPYVGGRIIDLSRAAANAVGLPGVGQVTVSVNS